MVKFKSSSVTLHILQPSSASGVGDVYRVCTTLVSLLYAFKTNWCITLRSCLSSLFWKSLLLKITSCSVKFFNSSGKSTPVWVGTSYACVKRVTYSPSPLLIFQSSVTFLIDSKPALFAHLKLSLTLLDNLWKVDWYFVLSTTSPSSYSVYSSVLLSPRSFGKRL